MGSNIRPVECELAGIGHANGVVAMAAINSKLFCATTDGKLWARDPLLSDVSWQEIGFARDVVAMAATNNTIFLRRRTTSSGEIPSLS